MIGWPGIQGPHGEKHRPSKLSLKSLTLCFGLRMLSRPWHASGLPSAWFLWLVLRPPRAASSACLSPQNPGPASQACTPRPQQSHLQPRSWGRTRTSLLCLSLHLPCFCTSLRSCLKCYPTLDPLLPSVGFILGCPTAPVSHGILLLLVQGACKSDE